jgi:hypothetical protein
MEKDCFSHNTKEDFLSVDTSIDLEGISLEALSWDTYHRDTTKKFASDTSKMDLSGQGH